MAQSLSRRVIEKLADCGTADAILASVKPVGEGCRARPPGDAKSPNRQGLTAAS